MTDDKDRTNAFPVTRDGWADGFGGMELRDYFAAKALHGLVQHWGNTSTPELARRAYEFADALMVERAK